MLLQRSLVADLGKALRHGPVALVAGPPRCGKSVLARQAASILGGWNPTFVEGRSPDAKAEFRNAIRRPGTVTILDDADRVPGWHEETPAADARVLALGSGFPVSVPGERFILGPFSIGEVGRRQRARHWFRGGFPEAFYAPDDGEARERLLRLADSTAEPGSGIPPRLARALLTGFAGCHGEACNENALARGLGVSRSTVVRAEAAFAAAGLLRILPSLAAPGGGRSVRAPALYLRDSGLFHALSGIEAPERLLPSPLREASWRGYVVEEALRLVPAGFEAARYRSPEGARLDLVLLRDGAPVAALCAAWRRDAPATRGMKAAADALGVQAVFVAVPEGGAERLGPVFVRAGFDRFLEDFDAAF